MIVRVSVVQLKMTTAQIVETPVNVNKGSIQDNTQPDNRIPPTYEDKKYCLMII